MINYIEKGAGLHDLIRRNGLWLRQVDGVWESPDDEAVQAIIDSYTPPDPVMEAKASKCVEVSLRAKMLRDRVVASISAGEMASWSIKRDEALSYAQLGEDAPCPALRAEAQVRGIPLEELVGKVNANAARFINAEAAIGGADGRHRDNISKLTTVDEVLAYDFSAGWPEV